MRSLGKLLQFVGLTLPLVSIFLQLNESITLWQMLLMLVPAVCCFGIGRILEGYAQ